MSKNKQWLERLDELSETLEEEIEIQNSLLAKIELYEEELREKTGCKNEKEAEKKAKKLASEIDKIESEAKVLLAEVEKEMNKNGIPIPD